MNLIRGCLDGVVPSILARAAADETPNITYASQAHCVDAQHLALLIQFINIISENLFPK